MTLSKLVSKSASLYTVLSAASVAHMSQPALSLGFGNARSVAAAQPNPNKGYRVIWAESLRSESYALCCNAWVGEAGERWGASIQIPNLDPFSHLV